MAAGKEIGMSLRKPYVDSHCRIPTIGDGRKARVQGRSQIGDHPGQRIREILVLAASKAMPCHDHATAKAILFGVKPGQFPAFVRREKALEHCAALRSETA
jgi:hypothetical protein